MNLSFEFTFLDILSQFHISPLLHQKPQHANIDYSRWIWRKPSSQPNTDHGPPTFGTYGDPPPGSWKEGKTDWIMGKSCCTCPWTSPHPSWGTQSWRQKSKRKVAVKSKDTKSKKKTGKAKHSAFHNGQNDCKESVKLAKTLYIQEQMNLMKKN